MTGNTSKECLNKTPIPEQVQLELSEIGGLSGLCNCLPTDDELQKICEQHHALSDPIRMKILYLVRIQSLCVCVIKACIGIADSKLSYHLAIMKKTGLISSHQEGNYIIYSITEEGKKNASGYATNE